MISIFVPFNVSHHVFHLSSTASTNAYKVNYRGSTFRVVFFTWVKERFLSYTCHDCLNSSVPRRRCVTRMGLGFHDTSVDAQVPGPGQLVTPSGEKLFGGLSGKQLDVLGLTHKLDPNPTSLDMPVVSAVSYQDQNGPLLHVACSLWFFIAMCSLPRCNFLYLLEGCRWKMSVLYLIEART